MFPTALAFLRNWEEWQKWTELQLCYSFQYVHGQWFDRVAEEVSEGRIQAARVFARRMSEGSTQDV